MFRRLTFKKAFGLGLIPVEISTWFLELGHNQFHFKHRNKDITMAAGTFGVTDQEKHAISLFHHTHDRNLEFIGEIPTIDISQDMDVNVPESIVQESNFISVANEFIEPFMDDACSALSHFSVIYSATHEISEGLTLFGINLQ